jgi:two-component system LytT family response regulator
MISISKAHLNILVLENNFEDQERCCRLINNIVLGCRIFRAQSGKDARDIFMENNIDAAFIDKGITDIDGFELAEVIYKIKQYEVLPVIFIARADDLSIENCNKVRHMAFIAKPYSDSEFIKKVSVLLDGIKNIKENNYIEAMMGEQSRRVKIISGDTENFIYIFDILFAESINRTLTLHTRVGTYIDIKMTLEELVDIIADGTFVRCHKSFAANTVNVLSVFRINDKVRELIFDVDGLVRCPLGNIYYHAVKEAYEKYQSSHLR